MRALARHEAVAVRTQDERVPSGLTREPLDLQIFVHVRARSSRSDSTAVALGRSCVVVTRRADATILRPIAEPPADVGTVREQRRPGWFARLSGRPRPSGSVELKPPPLASPIAGNPSHCVQHLWMWS